MSALALGFAGAGCANLITPGNVITEHAHGKAQEPDRAPSDGTYSLYSKYGIGTAYHTVSVTAGAPLGFRTARTGEIDVLAGDDEWTMTDGDYIWKRN